MDLPWFVANVPDYDIVVSEFEPMSPYDVHFWYNALEKDIKSNFFSYR